MLDSLERTAASGYPEGGRQCQAAAGRGRGWVAGECPHHHVGTLPWPGNLDKVAAPLQQPPEGCRPPTHQGGQASGTLSSPSQQASGALNYRGS